MSAFMVSDDTVRDALLILVDPKLPNEWYDTEGRNLIRLNQEALIERYGVEKAGTMESVEDRCLAFKHDYRTLDTVKVNVVKCVKAAQCVLYQCAEGKIPQTSSLYKRLEDRINATCRYLVSNTPEWQAAPWG